MTIDRDNAISLAILETEVLYLKAGMAELKVTNALQNSKLDEVLRTMNEAKGGWRLLVMMGGAAGTVGGLLSWAISHWRA